MAVLRDESEALYVSRLSKLAPDVEAGRSPEGWWGYCMLPWPWLLLPFLEGTNMWCSAIRLERRHRTGADVSHVLGCTIKSSS